MRSLQPVPMILCLGGLAACEADITGPQHGWPSDPSHVIVGQSVHLFGSTRLSRVTSEDQSIASAKVDPNGGAIATCHRSGSVVITGTEVIVTWDDFNTVEFRKHTATVTCFHTQGGGG